MIEQVFSYKEKRIECNGYCRCRKWTQWPEFKSWMSLFAFHFFANVLLKEMNPTQRWVNSKVAGHFSFSIVTRLGERKTTNSESGAGVLKAVWRYLQPCFTNTSDDTDIKLYCPLLFSWTKIGEIKRGDQLHLQLLAIYASLYRNPGADLCFWKTDRC